VPSCQVLFYLTDVTPGTHCFSVVPESLDAKRSLPVEEAADGRSHVGGYDQARLHPHILNHNTCRHNAWLLFWLSLRGAMGAQNGAWHTQFRPEGVDVHAPSGSVVIQNNVNFHAATIRQSTEPRVTLHVRARARHRSRGSVLDFLGS
jgi:hypothetical protein